MDNWKQRNRPIRLEKRFEFDTYDQTRNFLDLLGKHSELKDRYPDISFGKTYVNITLRPEGDNDNTNLANTDYKFAAEIDELID